MTYLVFDTPGLIDVRAFTTMGLSAKPASTNPIGYFGTGLKYAIATILRLGGRATIWIGRDEHDFFLEKDSFRGSEYQKIRMKRLRWSLTRATKHDLPFTISYGRNWLPWQAYRELESNTRDENGTTYLADASPTGIEGRTRIVVESPLLVEAFEKRDEVFLPGATREGQGVVATTGGPKDRFYWRGLRVLDLDPPALMTYNVLDELRLTEDRTLPEYQAKAAVARWVSGLDDEESIEAILSAEEENWEHGLTFNSWDEPSPAFKRVAARLRGKLFPGASSYWGAWAPKPPPRKLTGNPFVAFPPPWVVSFDGEALVDANGKVIFARPDELSEDEWSRLAEATALRIARGSRAKVVLPLAGRDLVEVA